MGLNTQVTIEIALKILPYARKGETVTYSQISDDIGQQVTPPNLGKYLTAISKACFEEGMPLLSSIVVSEETGVPGVGYFREFESLYGAPDDEEQAWQNECDEVFMRKNWMSLIQCLRADIS